MIHPAAELFFAGERRGHGTRTREAISRGTLVWVLCDLDRVLTPAELDALGPAYRELVEHFSYRDHQGHHVLCWDFGRYVNHSCRPSMRGLGRWAQIAVRDIAAGEEITCDYGECNLDAPLSCACDAPECRGTIRGTDLLEHAPAWDEEVEAAVRVAASLAGGLEQPLLPFLRDPERMAQVLAGRRGPPSIRELHYPGT